jgi:ABC-2 family transporter protein
MTWLLWRQHRAQAIVAAALLTIVGIILWISGVEMAHTYRSALATCRANDTCDNLVLFQGDGALIDLVNLTIVAPLLLAVFWGTGLVGREAETGTHTLAWTQSVPRRRWLNAKLVTLLVATIVWSAALSAVVTWWSGTFNSMNGNRFEPSKFEIQGVVPVAYSLFAVALGVAAGAILRRTLPAVAVTVFGYAAVRILVDNYLRPHLVRPLTTLTRLDESNGSHPGAWILSQNLFVNGHVVTGAIQAPAQCSRAALKTRGQMNTCVSDAGFRLLTKYEPASRYWPFQWIETGIFLGLAVVLIALCVVVVRRLDA